eukprot:gnl/Trimastix_PCT/2500.p1 GENE.gnl/Trimastix_PCT/2500~~gnl/Trimastix_PCT/2500.p1  ORF type:complete len:237 (+),score=94.25 gnl/Trimastix_PCT/2500:31-741(+)
MRFFFCGRVDAPDWLLSEVAVVSKISFLRVRALCNAIARFVLSGQRAFDYSKLEPLLSLREIQLTPEDVKAACAVLHFILVNAVRFQTPEETLKKELQQLGLPKEIGDAIGKTFVQQRDAIAAALTAETIQLPQFDRAEWRVDYLVTSNTDAELFTPSVHLRLHTRAPQPEAALDPLPPSAAQTAEEALHNESLAAVRSTQDVAFELLPSQLHDLVAELTQARSHMQAILDVPQSQ